MRIQGFWDKLEKEWDQIYRSTIIVYGDETLIDGIKNYKVYINGNIHGTPIRFEEIAPLNSILTKVEAGNYRIVIREFEVNKINRLESNTLNITLKDEEKIVIRASFFDNQLKLKIDE